MYKNSAYKRDKEKEEQCMAILKDKYAIIIGDRDGVPGPAIEECAKTAGAKIAYSSTECLSERPQVPWIWKTRRGF